MSTRPLLDAHAIIARWLGPRASTELLELVRERSTFTLCRYSGCVQARRIVRYRLDGSVVVAIFTQ